MSDKPMNVIIITSDEMRGDIPGYMGNPDCKTPALDRFAERGVVFDHHFTVHGKCVPSRIAMQTGRYCHTDGYRTINLHMPVDTPHLFGKLKERNYESAVFGHNHVWENKDFWGVDNVKGTGYIDYQSFTRDYFWPLLERKWPAPEPHPGAPEPLDLEQGRFHYTGRVTEPPTFFCDHNRAEQAVHYLKNVRDRSRPFYLHVNMGTPHPAYRCEEPFYSMYDRDRITPWPYNLPEGAPLPLTKMREFRSGDHPEAAFREIQSVYYGMCTRVDGHIGRVLETIEEEGLFDNSIVIFTTDHGDFAGQYGLPEKWDTCMSDCIMHVPMILHAPGIKGGHRVSALTEHIDFPSTVLELLGIDVDWGVHGQSMLPAIEGKGRKEAVFGDGGHEEEMWSRFNFTRKKDRNDNPKPLDGKQKTYAHAPESMSRTKMIRTEKWKLVMRLTGGNELYNMQEDPHEMKNLYPDHGKDPELVKVVGDLQQQMIEWCLRTDTDRPYEEKVGA